MQFQQHPDNLEECLKYLIKTSKQFRQYINTYAETPIKHINYQEALTMTIRMLQDDLTSSNQ